MAWIHASTVTPAQQHVMPIDREVAFGPVHMVNLRELTDLRRSSLYTPHVVISIARALLLLHSTSHLAKNVRVFGVVLPSAQILHDVCYDFTFKNCC